MNGVGLSLLAFGVGDLVSGGLVGTPRSARRAILGIVVTAAITCGVGFFLLSLPRLPFLSMLGVTVVPSVFWSWARLRQRHGWALAGLGTYGALTVGLAGWWSIQEPTALRGWLERMPFDRLAMEPGVFLLVTGCAALLLATTNGLVRSVLQSVGTSISSDEGRLRGGRVIGPIERLIIFGLAFAGEPTAAALIISAKSILRFPEISRSAARSDESTKADSPKSRVAGVDDVTEYFLLGSLVSWGVALATILFLPSPPP